MPLDDAPRLVGDVDTIARSIKALPGRALTFTARDVVQPAWARELELVPFWRIHDSRYVIYWRVVPPAR